LSFSSVKIEKITETPQQLRTSDTTADYRSREECIHTLFERQAEKTPDAIALISGLQQISYKELDRRASQLAFYLVSEGAGPEVPVGICLDRSPEMIVGILAILKAGSYYVPLDPKYPQNRLMYILEDSKINLLLTQRHLQNILSSALPESTKTICIDRVRRRIRTDIWIRESEKYKKNSASSTNLAYVIYTSGSTGKPKGVAIQHINAVYLLAWSIRYFSKDSLKTVLASTSICFDLSIYEIFVPLCNGGECLLIDDILSIDDTPSKYRLTLMNTVPSAAKALLSQNSIPDNVEVINLAGERLTTNLVDNIYAFSDVNLVNDLYGQSEATTYSTCAQRVENGDETIGKPIENNTTYTLNEKQQL